MSQVRPPIVNAPVQVIFTCGLTANWQPEGEAKDADATFVHTEIYEASDPRTLDPWAVRDDLFSLKDAAELQSFLNRTGLFDIRFPGRFSGLQEWKNLFHGMLSTKPDKWPKLTGNFDPSKLQVALRASSPTMKIVWDKGRHAITLPVGTTLDAIVAAILLDHLRGAEYAFCKKEDCGKPYPSRSNKLFCSYECAHHHNMREIRAKERLLRTNRGNRKLRS
jgi:hypothetical protein